MKKILLSLLLLSLFLTSCCCSSEDSDKDISKFTIKKKENLTPQEKLDYQNEVKSINNIVNGYIKNGLIEKIDIDVHSIYLNDDLWNYLNIDQKSKIGANSAEYIYLKEHKNLKDMEESYCHIKSYYSGKELAYYNIGGLDVK